VFVTDTHRVNFPLWTADPAVAWYNELDAITANDGSTDEVGCTPTKTAGIVRVANELADDSDPARADQDHHGATCSKNPRCDQLRYGVVDIFGRDSFEPLHADHAIVRHRGGNDQHGIERLLVGVDGHEPIGGVYCWHGADPFREKKGTSLTVKLWLAQEPEADQLLAENPVALLIGMVLDQQIPLEIAFRGPKKIADRMGGFDAHEIADYDPDKFAALCSEKPAIHRFPGSMAKRIQSLAQIIVDRYDGDAAALWAAGDPDGSELLRRLKGLPGFGEQKARIFLALLGKQYGVTPTGWRAAAGEFGQPGTHISVADIVDARSLGQVRSHKKQMKAAKAAKQ
jgi:uncharacterized HhH-GPD family protein